ncbi:MAG: CcmD family protein [Dehalococcoidia bacterium]|nr:CcmD family protein [Dehalococcoidia bacterium]
MPGLTYIAAAYGVIWVLLFVYLITIHQRLGNVREQLEAARKRIGVDIEHHADVPVREHVGDAVSSVTWTDKDTERA